MQKHTKYDIAAEDLSWSFTPLISSTEVRHKEHAAFHNRSSEALSVQWKKPPSQVNGCIRV